MSKISITPSILAADFGHLQDEIDMVEPFVDALHIDIMDGHFVPNLSFGPGLVACLKSNLPFHIHLMVDNPQNYIKAFSSKQNSTLIFHIEIDYDLPKMIQQIKQAGMKVGIAVKPETSIDCLDPFMSDLDLVLIMTVEPGFGGQRFMQSMLSKIENLRQKFPRCDIAVDGGIVPENAFLVKQAGANILVAGTAIFHSDEPLHVIDELKSYR